MVHFVDEFKGLLWKKIEIGKHIKTIIKSTSESRIWKRRLLLNDFQDKIFIFFFLYINYTIIILCHACASTSNTFGFIT